MSVISILIGLLLCGLTVFGMVGSPEKLAVAFVPMMLGIPMVFCGVVSLNPHRQKVWMRVAALVAAIGLASASWQLTKVLGMAVNDQFVPRMVVQMLAGIIVFCGSFLLLFGIDLRRRILRERRAAAREHPKRRPDLEQIAVAVASDPQAATMPTAELAGSSTIDKPLMTGEESSGGMLLK